MSDLQLQDRITEDHFMNGLRDMGQEINALVALAVNALTRQSQTREMAASLDEALGGEQALQEASERLRRTLPGAGFSLGRDRAEQTLHELDRAGDHAEAVAKIARSLPREAGQRVLLDLPGMAGCVRYMLGTALEALATGDAELVEMVALTQEQVEAFAKQLRARLPSSTAAEREAAEWAAAMLAVVGHLERMACAAVRIAAQAGREEVHESRKIIPLKQPLCACPA